eukprot:10456244-Alexandrium_andersonii.AAC.1
MVLQCPVGDFRAFHHAPSGAGAVLEIQSRAAQGKTRNSAVFFGRRCKRLPDRFAWEMRSHF